MSYKKNVCIHNMHKNLFITLHFSAQTRSSEHKLQKLLQWHFFGYMKCVLCKDIERLLLHWDKLSLFNDVRDRYSYVYTTMKIRLVML